jgi:hypothetical protein
MEVWLLQDASSLEVLGVYSSRDKAIEASSRYVEIKSLETEASDIKVQMKVLLIDQ